MPTTKTKSKPSLEPRVETLTLHGHEISYSTAGSGPVLLLIHGITGSKRHWDSEISLLAERFTVIAPDMLGHGLSAKPRGDYSLGAFASGARDMLVALGHERATVVGHSLGGGVAMQFAYQFPERCERLVLVSAGGLGPEVNLLLRAAALPGSELVLPLISNLRVTAMGEAVSRFFGRLGLRAGPDLAEVARGYASLADSETRHAFIHTLRAVIDPGGQRINATDRLYLAEEMPSLIVWGAKDPVIPVGHGEAAHYAMPGSRFEVFDGAGHFPQLNEPVRFARLLTEFVDSTEPAEVDYHTLRDRILQKQQK
jgi:pimeloyl-ACP methyl ester carboxylesterase